MPTLQFDAKGSSELNYIKNQTKILSAGGTKAVVLDYGVFYDKDFIMRDANTGRILTPNLDYVMVHPVTEVIAATGLSAFAAVIVKKAGVSQVAIDARMVGGIGQLPTSVIEAAIAAIENDSREISFNNIYDIPSEFFPTSHTHSAMDIGFPNIINALFSIVEKLAITNNASTEAIYTYINQFLEQVDPHPDITNPSLWGALYFKNAGFQICYGMTPTGNVGERYRLNFKRSFSSPPMLFLNDNVRYNWNTPPDTYSTPKPYWNSVDLDTESVDINLQNDPDWSTSSFVGPVFYLAFGLATDSAVDALSPYTVI